MPLPSIGPLDMLADDDLLFQPGGEIFAPLVADTLGNAGGPDDGFDSLFNPVAQSFAQDAAGLSEMDDHLATSDFVPGQFDTDNAGPVMNDIGAFLGNGDALMHDFDQAIGFVNSTPPAGTDPNPPNAPQPPSAPPPSVPSPPPGSGGGEPCTGDCPLPPGGVFNPVPPVNKPEPPVNQQ